MSSDDYWSPTFLGIGNLHNVGDGDEERELATVVWVPDIDAPHKWRERPIYKTPKPSRQSRPIGFRKP